MRLQGHTSKHEQRFFLILFLHKTPAVSVAKHDVSTGLPQPFSSKQQKKKMPTFLILLVLFRELSSTSRFKKVGIFFFCCLLENGWGNPVETSCFATLTAGVL